LEVTKQKHPSGLELIYEGSVKRVFKTSEKPDRLFFHFTDDYSVFDWGKMPDTIENKGRALAKMGAFFFKQLGAPDIFQRLKGNKHLERFDKAFLDERYRHPVFEGVCGVVNFGLPHHFRELIEIDNQDKENSSLADSILGTTHLMEVLTARVERPELHQIDGQPTYFYPHTQAQSAAQMTGRRLVPLEIVFRFGMPAGSSLKERLEKNPDYARQLGLKVLPKEGDWLQRPVIEFFTKLEPKDRLLSTQEAAHISGLNASEFEYLTEMSFQAALALFVLFAEKGIELWDGKFEMIIDYGTHKDDGSTGTSSGGILLLADSVGPDELRLIYKGVHLSKEMIRRIYRGTAWEESLKKAQLMAKGRGVADWKGIALGELKSAPERLAGDEKASIDKLYGTLANHLIGEPVFENHPTLDQFVNALPAKLKGEASVAAQPGKR
jgi:phosphoribosylaminoimidazole-succinocarboxamide synthase